MIRRIAIALLGIAAAIILLPWVMRGLGYYVDNPGWEVGEIAAKKGNPNLCYKIIVYWHFFGPTGSQRQGECFFRYATVTLDPSVCEFLLPSEYGLACLSDVGGRLETDIPCTRFAGRNEVYCNAKYSEGEITIKNPQTENCNLYKRKDLRDWCHYSRTYLYKNVHECTLITHESVRNICEEGYAFKQKDPSLCDMLKNEQQQKYCKIRINAWIKYPKLRSSSYFGASEIKKN